MNPDTAIIGAVQSEGRTFRSRPSARYPRRPPRPRLNRSGSTSGHPRRRNAIAGASERPTMKQTGHRSVQMVRRYIRNGSLFRDNSAAKLGL
jgi:hypothetical protein